MNDDATTAERGRWIVAVRRIELVVIDQAVRALPVPGSNDPAPTTVNAESVCVGSRNECELLFEELLLSVKIFAARVAPDDFASSWLNKVILDHASHFYGLIGDQCW